MERNRTSALEHLKRISDYLELGETVWYRVHDSAIEFLDGFEEPSQRDEGPTPTHFR